MPKAWRSKEKKRCSFKFVDNNFYEIRPHREHNKKALTIFRVKMVSFTAYQVKRLGVP